MTSKILILLAILAAIGVAGFTGYQSGHRNGINEQKAVDQVEFDRINQALTAQKSEAAARYKTLADEAIAKQAEVDAFKTQLEMNRAKNQNVIDGLRRDLASRGLRFSAPEGSGCGGGGGGPQGTETQTASTHAPTIIELPRKIADDLRQLTFDADQLRVEYQRCYDWANSPVVQ